jgi:exo-beta-1,3-glucanase (GH17 family)
VRGVGAGLLVILQLSATPADADLDVVLRLQHWIAFAPTGYYPAESPPVLPGRQSIATDLRVLRSAGFTGLITYGAEVKAIADVADAMGFRRMLVGVWNPFDHDEIAGALSVVGAHRKMVAGLVAGNEGLLTGRYRVEDLCGAMDKIRRAAQKPVSSTETVDVILGEPRLVSCSDFITVNAHPYFSNQKKPAEAVQWTVEAWEAIRKQYPSKALLFKETGLPTTASAGMSEDDQADFYDRLVKTEVVFSYFEAFDASPRFKEGALEQSWGLWRTDRSPKAIVRKLPFRPSLR